MQFNDVMDDIVKDFLIESNENLDRLDQELVKLESEPSSKELLASIFRTIHTIKGSCGFLGFSHLEKVAHAGESLLSKLRDGQVTLDAEITSALLAMVDAVRRMLAQIQSTEHDGDDDHSELLERLKRCQNRESSPESSASGQRESAGESEQKSAGKVEASDLAEHVPVPGKIGGVLVNRGDISPADLAMALKEQEKGDRRPVGEILVSMGLGKPEDISQAQQILAAETVRVGVTLLDKLMNLVGELVLARNQLLQFSNSIHDAGFHAVSQRMNLIATELQEDVMKTRMQPIGNIWNKFPRTVRDLALNCGREVRLEMEGQDTELDRTIIEAIKDPLTHLVRNAIDHGIEAPAARKQAGKDSTGKLKLRAFHEGGQVNIEVSDDGAGLNAERIRRKAMDRGLINTQQAARMNDREVFNLIFLPGFSTAEQVTNISGRGVGMDVVKTNIEKIGGAVDVQSTSGQGTTVRIKIPLTLAIVPALMVSCGGERFAIPQVSLLELVRLEADGAGGGIEMVHGAPVYRLRGNLLPLVHLDRELQLRPAGSKGDSAAANIVVLQAESRQFGLVVDGILDTEEIVVKPLGKQLKGINAYSGATIMGDGRVALILDVLGLAQRAKVVCETHERTVSALSEAKQQESDEAGDRKPMLLFEYGQKGRMAIDLSMVARLEEFPSDAIETADGREAVQYRGQIMPLIRVSEVLKASNCAGKAGTDAVQVVVYAEGSRCVGLVIDRILDIVEESIHIERQTGRQGILGSAVIQKRITDVLEVPALIAASNLSSTTARANA